MQKELFEKLKLRIESKIDNIIKAQREAQQEANSHKGAMESRYDTFKEEAQEKVAQFEVIIRRLRGELQVLMIMAQQPIANNFFSFITLTDGKNEVYLFLSPVLSGEKIERKGKIFFITSKDSTIGSLLVNRKEGEKVIFNGKEQTILKIERKLV